MRQRTRWTFAGFDIDVRTGVLSKGGESVRIGRQAFRALALLVSRDGALVTRDELQKEIWGDRVHVDFEHGLNVCIRQVRAALGDEGARQIIVTCPREGYRLGVPVKAKGNLDSPSVKRWSAVAAAMVVFVGVPLLLKSALLTSPVGSPAASSSTASPWPTRNLEAYEWYWRGRAYFDRSTGRKPFAALPYFERAAALDPGFALAQAGVAASYIERAAAGIEPAESANKARHAVQRALALDVRAPETHVAAAEVSYRLDEDDLGAEREFLRAVELDGRNPYVRQRYAVFLREQRRFDAALAQLDVAQALDPLSVLSSWQKADVLFLAQRWEESLRQTYQALELDPTHSWSFRTLGQNLEALGRREEAIEAYLKAGQVAFGHLGRAYALVGRRAAAEEILNALTRRPLDELGHNGVSVAYIYTGLGEPEKALEWLEKAHNDGVRLPFSLRVAPQWEPLRTSRGFDAFLKKTRVAGI